MSGNFGASWKSWQSTFGLATIKQSELPLLAMHIVLLRRGSRALILPGGKDLIDCPLLVRHWLGAPDTRGATELTRDTPLPGIAPPVVLAEVLQKGFCALDVYGVVHGFESPLQADFTD